MASAGPYASLHLAPDRQPYQHPNTEFFTGRMPFLTPNQQCQSTEGNLPPPPRGEIPAVSKMEGEMCKGGMYRGVSNNHIPDNFRGAVLAPLSSSLSPSSSGSLLGPSSSSTVTSSSCFSRGSRANSTDLQIRKVTRGPIYEVSYDLS